MKKSFRFSVIGAGNGGIAMAGYLAKLGFTVNLYNRTVEKILPLIKNPIITLSGEEKGRGILNMVTSNIEEAIRDTDMVMVTIPAIGHSYIAKAMAPYLKNGQIVVLNPGRTGGALEVYNTIRKNGCNRDIVVAEAQTFIYACRATSTNSAHIFKVKNEVSLSAIPARRTNMVIELLSEAYNQFKPAKDVIETSLNNYGAIFHPTPTLLNCGHIERGASFEYYKEGITPSIGKFLEKIDGERMKIAVALNVESMSAKDWLYESYGAIGGSLYEAVQNNPAYNGLNAPKGLNRYIYEDVPYSLVPMSSLGKHLNIETPAIDSIIKLAELVTGDNFWQTGRTVDRLGLSGLSVEDIHLFAQEGTTIKESSENEVVA